MRVSELQDALVSIDAPADPDARLGLVLNWLAGTGRSEYSRRLETVLAPSEQRPELMLAVHDWLDEKLFGFGSLDERAAGVDPSHNPAERRRRYRQLLAAFHPDRHPELGERLTERLQTINQAYARFKRDPNGEEAIAVVDGAKPAPAREPVEPVRYEGIAPTRSTKTAAGWRERWGQDRFLGHKLVLLMALLLMFPLVSIYLDDAPAPDWPGGHSDPLAVSPEAVRAPLRLPPGVDVWMAHWPPLAEPPPPWQLPEVADDLPLEAAGLAEQTPEPWIAAMTELLDISDWSAPALPDEPASTASQVSEPEPPALADPIPAEPAVAEVIVLEPGLVEPTPAAPTSAEPALAEPAAVEATVAGTASPEPPVIEPSVEPPAIAALPPAEEPQPDAPLAELSATDPPQPEPAVEPAPALAATEVLEAPEPLPEAELAMALVEEAAPIEPESPEEAPPRAGGELQLGILARHEVGRVLDTLQQSVEAGDIDQLLGVLSNSPSGTGGQGRDWFERQYGELFEQTTHRALSLQVLSARRDGREWVVEARYELITIGHEADGKESQAGQVIYTLQPERGRMRIASVDHQ